MATRKPRTAATAPRTTADQPRKRVTGGPRKGGGRRRRPRPEFVGPKWRDPRFEGILSEIGTPEEKPFHPDAFQLESLEKLRETDVLVSAPTGTGKTWIALEAIRSCLADGGHAWYACPLKALSNAKYEEFARELGTDKLGILTGDRRENPQAPVIVGTTEILRNQLYDTMSRRVDLPYELVILDEAHYLGEQDRGVVWEESLIYLPRNTRLLLLSASIANCDEIADWMTSIREVPCRVVATSERPVPLHPLFIYPDGTITLLGGKRGLTRDVRRCVKAMGRRRHPGSSSPHRFGKVIKDLRRYNLLPAIFFLKSRSECDRSVSACSPVERTPEAEAAMQRDLETVLEQHPYLRDHRGLPEMIENGVAAHHAGHLPFWKVMVEQMMLKGHLDAIFATSTVAGGVNFPARTVVLVQSDRFNGKEFQDLSSTDLQQMIGRAGRRGKDNVGFALVVPGPYQDPELIHERFGSPPDPIESQIRMNFCMVLNLLDSHSPEEVRVLVDSSLAAYQQEKRFEKLEQEGKKRKSGTFDVRDALWRDFLRHRDFLKEAAFVDEEDRLTWEGQWAAQLRLDHPLLVAEAIRTGSLEGAPPEVLAGLIAPFVVDGERKEEYEGGLKVSCGELLRYHSRMKKDLQGLSKRLEKKGFPFSEVPSWPGVAVYLWATGVSWEALLKVVSLEEGALAMLIMRTADHLNQIIGLRESHPDLSGKALDALPLIYREPVWF